MDTRRKNVYWKLNLDSRGIPDAGNARLAVLMDIRDELQRLNSLLYCSNFTGIPGTLRSIRRALAKPRPRGRSAGRG